MRGVSAPRPSSQIQIWRKYDNDKGREGGRWEIGEIGIRDHCPHVEFPVMRAEGRPFSGLCAREASESGKLAKSATKNKLLSLSHCLLSVCVSLSLSHTHAHPLTHAHTLAHFHFFPSSQTFA
jgi:hypothetical protein